jgi:hypothetical protein
MSSVSVRPCPLARAPRPDSDPHPDGLGKKCWSHVCLSRHFHPAYRYWPVRAVHSKLSGRNRSARGVCAGPYEPSRHLASGDLPDSDGSGPGTRTPATLKGFNATIVLISSRSIWLTNTIDQIVKELPRRPRPAALDLTKTTKRIHPQRCRTNHHSTLSAGARMLLSNPPRPSGDTRYVPEARVILTPGARRSTPESRFFWNWLRTPIAIHTDLT